MNILLVGSFHGKNKGDEAIALAEIQTLRMLIPGCGITIASQNPDYFRQAYASLGIASVRISNPFSVLRAIARADAVVVGGGGLFFEPHRGHIFRIDKNQSLVWPILCRIAQLLRTPSVLWGVGAEPITTPFGQRIIAWGLNAARAILVRDPKTKALFTSYGVRVPITVVADSAWLLQTKPAVQTPAQSRGGANTYCIGVSPHFGISILENAEYVAQYHKTFAAQLDAFAQQCTQHKNIEFIFLPLHKNDAVECEAIRALMHYPHTRLQPIHTMTPMDIVALLGTLNMQIGMRMHGTILATLAGVPSVSIIYANKVTETVQYIYGASPVNATDLSLPYTAIDQLAKKMLACMHHEQKLCVYLRTFKTRVQKESFVAATDALRSAGLLPSLSLHK